MGIRRARLVSALLATTAIGIGAVELRANLTARAELSRFLDRRHDVEVASLFAEPFTGRLRLHDVTVRHGAARLTIGTLDVPLPRQDFSLVTAAAASPFDDKSDDAKPEDAKPEAVKPEEAPAPPAAAAASPAADAGTSADNVTIVSGTTTYHIKHIDMSGTPLSSADLARIVDTAGPETLEARLRKLTATSINVPEILVDDTSSGAAQHVTVTQVVLAGATAGKVAAASTGGITFSLKDGTDDLTGTTGAIQASNIDLAQIAHVFGTVRSDDAEQILPLYDSVGVTALKITNTTKKSTFTLAALKETGAKARPLKTDALSGSGTAKLSNDQEVALYDDFIHSFEIGSIEATDLGGQGADSGIFSLGSVSLQSMAKAAVGGFGLRALRYDGPDAKFGVAAIDVGPVTLPLPARIAGGARGAMPSAGKVDVTQIDFDGKGDGQEADGTPKRVKFKVAHAGFVSDGEPGDLPKTSKMNIDNITFDVPASAGQAQPLYDMGYRALDVSLGLAATYDAPNQSLSIHDLSLNGASMGSLALGLHLVNVTKGLVSPNPEVVKASALAILAKGITLAIVNDGLIDKALIWKAKQDGTDVGKEKDVLIDFFANKLPASVNNSANAKLVGAAVAKFVAEPKNLTISVESKSGLGLGSMALLSDPGLLIDTLDIKAVANQ
jgi:hypothetical protein